MRLARLAKIAVNPFLNLAQYRLESGKLGDGGDEDKICVSLLIMQFAQGADSLAKHVDSVGNRTGRSNYCYGICHFGRSSAIYRSVWGLGGGVGTS